MISSAPYINVSSQPVILGNTKPQDNTAGEAYDAKSGAEQSQTTNKDTVTIGQQNKENVTYERPKNSSAPNTTDKSSSKDELNTLTEEEEKQVQELKKRDAEVRAHEQAHAAVGGQYAGAPSYEYQSGPDGKKYAVGGEVSIDVGEEDDPEATIQKMQIVQRAALAPAEPSAQDYKVAAEAAQKEQVARAELGKQSVEGDEDEDKSSANASKLSAYHFDLGNAESNNKSSFSIQA